MTTEIVCVPRELLRIACSGGNEAWQALEELRTLMSQPAASEPVAWLTGLVVWSGEASARNHANTYELRVEPLYRHPPALADHIPAVGNMVKGPVGQIERWFCEGRDSVSADQCRYDEHSLARHWWSRGFSYMQRLYRAIAAEQAYEESTAHINDIHGALDCEMECPCCQRRDTCEDECTFVEDAPSDAERLAFIRDVLTRNAVSPQPIEGSTNE